MTKGKKCLWNILEQDHFISTSAWVCSWEQDRREHRKDTSIFFAGYSHAPAQANLYSCTHCEELLVTLHSASFVANASKKFSYIHCVFSFEGNWSTWVVTQFIRSIRTVWETITCFLLLQRKVSSCKRKSNVVARTKSRYFENEGSAPNFSGSTCLFEIPKALVLLGPCWWLFGVSEEVF